MLPLLLPLLLLLLPKVHARTLDHPLMPIYAVFVILWSSALLVLWRQRCSELAYRYGVDPCDDSSVGRRRHHIISCHVLVWHLDLDPDPDPDPGSSPGDDPPSVVDAVVS